MAENIHLNTGSNDPPSSPELSPTSPIGRRYRHLQEGEGEADAIQPAITLECEPTSSKYGRPAELRPLHPYRKSQKSSLSLAKDIRMGVQQPQGYINTGTDCFALSLFQILARQNEWNETLDSLMATRGSSDRVARLFSQFRQSILSPNIREFPQLKDVLKGQFNANTFIATHTYHLVEARLIDNHLSGQQDPVELLMGLINHFDAIAKTEAFHAILGTTVECNVRCSKGHDYSHTGTSQSVMMVYPSQAFTRGLIANTFALLSSCLRSYSDGTMECETCSSTNGNQARYCFSSFGRLLAINLVWPISPPEERTSPKRLVASAFDISTDVDLSSLMKAGLKGPQSHSTGKLCGVLCKQGVEVTGGHYISYIQQDGEWWRMDDHRVTVVPTLSDAFRSSRVPVLLLYKILSDDGNPSASTACIVGSGPLSD